MATSRLIIHVATNKLLVRGMVKHAHPECGNGVIWALEVRRGSTTERLASVDSQRAKPVPLGPFENVHIEAGQVVALIIGPRDGNHSCDLTAVNRKLTDGAEWIWDLAQIQFPGASGLLDIYHASTHISDAAKALFGDGTPEAKAWPDQGRHALLADGWFGICEHMGATLATEKTPEQQRAVEGLTNDLAKHTEHLND